MGEIEKLIDAIISNAEILGATKQQERAKSKERKYQKLVDSLKSELLKKVTTQTKS